MRTSLGKRMIVCWTSKSYNIGHAEAKTGIRRREEGGPTEDTEQTDGDMGMNCK